MSDNQLIHTYSMGFSRQEFLERVHKQKTFTDFEISNDNITINWKSGTIVITLGQEGRRKLGSLFLTTLDIKINLQALAKIDHDPFLSLFTIAFHKGGG